MKSNDWRHKNVAPYTPGNTKILYFFNCLLDGMHTKIKHICDFSRCRLNVRVKALTSNLCSEATNMLYLSFWVLLAGRSENPLEGFRVCLKNHSSNLHASIYGIFSLWARLFACGKLEFITHSPVFPKIPPPQGRSSSPIPPVVVFYLLPV